MFQIPLYFAKKFTDWMFKQKTDVIVLFVFVIVLCWAVVGLWMKIGAMETDGKIERLEIRRDCAKDISDLRDELRECQAQKDTLSQRLARLAYEVRQGRKQ